MIINGDNNNHSMVFWVLWDMGLDMADMDMILDPGLAGWTQASPLLVELHQPKGIAYL